MNHRGHRARLCVLKKISVGAHLCAMVSRLKPLLQHKPINSTFCVVNFLQYEIIVEENKKWGTHKAPRDYLHKHY